MKKIYVKPDADKISFNYRDQVVAASPGGEESGGSFMQNFSGLGSPFCGSGGIMDYVADIFRVCD